LDNKMNNALLVLFILLQIGDFATTYLAIQSGKGHEANPLIASLFDKIGVIPTLSIYKIIGIACGIYLMNYWIVLLVLNLIFIYVVYQNYQIYKK